MKPSIIVGILLFSCLMTIMEVSEAASTDQQVTELRPGESVDAYFEINLSGQLFIYIVAEPGGEACADFWWIKWPLGRNEDVGRFCNEVTFKIPGWSSLAISSKLRAGGARNRIKIVVRANEEVANKLSISF